MTERLSDVETRIGTVHQLAAVVTAMRGIAAARSREARGQLDGIRTYAGMIAVAIGRALAARPEEERLAAPGPGADGHAVIALCAEQGFAGAFSEHVLDAAQHAAGAARPHHTELLLVGDRGLIVARERGMDVDWTVPMVVHPTQVAGLANRIMEALYERLDSGRVRRVTVVHAVPDAQAALRIAETRLVPFDFDRFPTTTSAVTPILTLPYRTLLAGLAEEYVFAQLCEALMLSFAAENEARTRAMITARTNVTNTLSGLVARSRQLRQEEITNEIVELAGGAAATRIS
jgi:F-type H+-transporting ATPase subunit gamma